MNDPTGGPGEVPKDAGQLSGYPWRDAGGAAGVAATPGDTPEKVVFVLAEPFTPGEFRRVVLRPHLLIEYFLGSTDRLARNLSDGKALWAMAGLLLAASVVATVPYGLVCPSASFWKVATLFTGSLLICFPCLYVFGQFVGFKLDLAQYLALALILTGAAGLFTFGFFPIIWFISFSMKADPQSLEVSRGLSAFLLGFSLLMGIVQMGRCLADPGGPARRIRYLPLLIGLWMPLLIFITYRMAVLLELP